MPIDAIDCMAKAWAAAIRSRLTPTKLDPIRHEWRKASGESDGQGYAPASFIERIREMRDLAGSRTERLSQYNEEALRGEALLFARCLHGAPLELRQVAQLHYIERETIRKKAKYAGWTLEVYYRHLDGLHYFVSGRLQALDVPDKSV